MRPVGEIKMMHRSLVLSLAFAAVVLPGFSQQQTQQPQPASNQIEPLSVLAVPAGYRYDPHGRRDPFVNPIPKPVKDEAAAAKHAKGGAGPRRNFGRSSSVSVVAEGASGALFAT